MPPTSNEIQLEDFLALMEERCFVDHFNVFLMLPVFGQNIIYIHQEKGFEFFPQIRRPRSFLEQSFVMKWLFVERFPKFRQSLFYFMYQMYIGINDFSFHVDTAMSEGFDSPEDAQSFTAKVLGSVLGMKRFRDSLIGTVGEKVYHCWLDIEALRQADDIATRKFYLAKIKTTYITEKRQVNTGRKCRAFQEVLNFGVVPESCSEYISRYMSQACFSVHEEFTLDSVKTLEEVQKLLTDALKTYWVPRYIVHVLRTYPLSELQLLFGEDDIRKILKVVDKSSSSVSLFFTEESFLTSTQCECSFLNSESSSTEIVSGENTSNEGVSGSGQNVSTRSLSVSSCASSLNTFPKRIQTIIDDDNIDEDDSDDTGVDEIVSVPSLTQIQLQQQKERKETKEMAHELLTLWAGGCVPEIPATPDSSCCSEVASTVDDSIFDSTSLSTISKSSLFSLDERILGHVGLPALEKKSLGKMVHCQKQLLLGGIGDDVPLPRANLRIIRALASDSFAGYPFRDFLSKNEQRQYLTYINFWNDIQNYLRIDPLARDENGNCTRKLGAQRIMNKYLISSAITQIFSERMKKSLFTILSDGKDKQLLYAARDIVTIVLGRPWRDYTEKDKRKLINSCFKKAYLTFMRRQLPPTLVTPEMTKIYSVAKGEYFDQAYRNMWDCMDSGTLWSENLDKKILSEEHCWKSLELTMSLEGCMDVSENLSLSFVLMNFYGSLDLWDTEKKQTENLADLTRLEKQWRVADLKVSNVVDLPQIIIPEELKVVTEHKRGLPQLWKNGSRLKLPSQAPRSFMEVLVKKEHYEYFKAFLQYKNCNIHPLQFWMAVNDMKNAKNLTLSEMKSKCIFYRYFKNDKTHGGILQCKDAMLNSVAEMKTVNVAALFGAQQSVYTMMEANWYPSYLALFSKRGPVKLIKIPSAMVDQPSVPKSLSMRLTQTSSYLADLRIIDVASALLSSQSDMRTKLYLRWNYAMQKFREFIKCMTRRATSKVFEMYLKQLPLPPEELSELEKIKNKDLIMKDKEITGKDKEPAIISKDSNQKDKNFVPKEKDSIPKDKDSVPKDKNSVPKDKDSVPKDKNSVPKDKDSAPKDKNSVPKDKDSVPKDNHSAPKDKDSASKEKDSISKEKDSIHKDRSQLECDLLCKEKTSHGKSRLSVSSKQRINEHHRLISRETDKSQQKIYIYRDKDLGVISIRKLPRDLHFWIEINKYKYMVDSLKYLTRVTHVDSAILLAKARVLVKCFLSAEIGTKARVNIPEEMVGIIIRNLNHRGPLRSLFHDAGIKLTPVLFQFWKRFKSDWPHGFTLEQYYSLLKQNRNKAWMRSKKEKVSESKPVDYLSEISYAGSVPDDESDHMSFCISQGIHVITSKREKKLPASHLKRGSSTCLRKRKLRRKKCYGFNRSLLRIPIPSSSFTVFWNCTSHDEVF